MVSAPRARARDRSASPAPRRDGRDGRDGRNHGADRDEPALDFRPSGKLAAEANRTSGGAVLKYHEPADAVVPPGPLAWRAYVYKHSREVDVVSLGGQSAYLVGRDRAIADVPVDHPSASKQHAVIQYRRRELRAHDGRPIARIRPYIIDLESANGTVLNGSRLPPAQLVQIQSGDMVKIGYSTREYVFIPEDADTLDAATDDDDIVAGGRSADAIRDALDARVDSEGEDEVAPERGPKKYGPKSDRWPG